MVVDESLSKFKAKLKQSSDWKEWQGLIKRMGGKRRESDGGDCDALLPHTPGPFWVRRLHRSSVVAST